MSDIQHDKRRLWSIRDQILRSSTRASTRDHIAPSISSGPAYNCMSPHPGLKRSRLSSRQERKPQSDKRSRRVTMRVTGKWYPVVRGAVVSGGSIDPRRGPV